MEKIAALFLDRDGIINLDHGYVHQVSRFEFVDGIFDLARKARVLGYCIVVVTNQAGIGRGYYLEEQFHSLSTWMCERFLQENAPIRKIYFSPFHPTEGIGYYRQDHPSRKPHPGMFLQAERELSLDMGRSVMIGDKVSDMIASMAAGVGTNLLLKERSSSTSESIGYIQIASLNEACLYLG
jgi:D-glycero-D-manno-heptose 1,7-bisphosphate phosphatase